MIKKQLRGVSFLRYLEELMRAVYLRFSFKRFTNIMPVVRLSCTNNFLTLRALVSVVVLIHFNVGMVKADKSRKEDKHEEDYQ